MRLSELRAVENRRWLLHATVGGFSEAVDPYGDVPRRLPDSIQDMGTVQVERRDDISWFTRGGWLFGPACFVATIQMLLIALAYRAGRKFKGSTNHPTVVTEREQKTTDEG